MRYDPMTGKPIPEENDQTDSAPQEQNVTETQEEQNTAEASQEQNPADAGKEQNPADARKEQNPAEASQEQNADESQQNVAEDGQNPAEEQNPTAGQNPAGGMNPEQTQPDGYAYHGDGDQAQPQDGYDYTAGGNAGQAQQQEGNAGQAQPGSQPGYADYGTYGAAGAGASQMPPKKRSRKPIVIAAIIVAAAVICAVVLKLTVFANPAEKIIKAYENTFAVGDDPLAAQLKKGSDIFKDGEFSVNGTFEAISANDIDNALQGEESLSDAVDSGTNIQFDYDQNRDGQSLKLSVNDDSTGTNVDITEVLDDENLTVSLGDLYDTPLQYPYTTDKSDSALSDMVGDSATEMLDSALKAFYSLTQKDQADFKKISNEHMKELDFEKTGTKSIGGVNCTGYKAELSGDWFKELYSDMMDGVSTDELDQFINLLTQSQGLDLNFDMLDGTEITYYLHGDRVVSMEIHYNSDAESEEDTVNDLSSLDESSGTDNSDLDSSLTTAPSVIRMTFTGDEIPWYETEVEMENDSGDTLTMSLSVERDGSKTSYNASLEEGEDQANYGSVSLVYDSDDNSFAVSDNEGDEIVSGTIEGTDGSLKIEAEDPEDSSNKLEVTIEDDAEIAEIDGDPVDISEWTQDDWGTFVSDLSSAMY